MEVWDQYSFVRRNDPLDATTDRVIMRLGNLEKLNSDFPDNESCNLTFNMGICARIRNDSNGATSHSNTRFAEMIMYRVGLEDDFLNEIEENQIAFWNL